MQLILACSNRWTCQVAGPGAGPGIRRLLASFAAFELPPRYTLACYAFMAGPLYFFHYARQVLFTSSCHPAVLPFPPPSAFGIYPVRCCPWAFIACFMEIFKHQTHSAHQTHLTHFRFSTPELAPALSSPQSHPYPCGLIPLPLVFVLVFCRLHICACPSCLPSANLDGPKCTWAELCVYGSICYSIYSKAQEEKFYWIYSLDFCI